LTDSYSRAFATNIAVVTLTFDLLLTGFYCEIHLLWSTCESNL